MTREEAKAFYPILQAFAEGKVIETRTDPNVVGKDLEDMNDWTEMNEIEFWNNTEYRIKPEPKYRPFKDAEECWAEMQKHQPFGWIKGKVDGLLYLITAIVSKNDIRVDGVFLPLDWIEESYTFADDTPFGAKVEE